MIRVVPNEYLPHGHTGAIRFDTDSLRELALDELLANHTYMAVRPSVMLALLDGYETHYRPDPPTGTAEAVAAALENVNHQPPVERKSLYHRARAIDEETKQD